MRLCRPLLVERRLDQKRPLWLSHVSSVTRLDNAVVWLGQHLGVAWFGAMQYDAGEGVGAVNNFFWGHSDGVRMVFLYSFSRN